MINYYFIILLFIRQALCRFFTDKKVKVSLFLQDGIQRQDGTIALSYKGPLPPGVEVRSRRILRVNSPNEIRRIIISALLGADTGAREVILL